MSECVVLFRRSSQKVPGGSTRSDYLAPGSSGKLVIGARLAAPAAPPAPPPLAGRPANLTARIVNAVCNVEPITVWNGAASRSRNTVNRTIGSR